MEEVSVVELLKEICKKKINKKEITKNIIEYLKEHNDNKNGRGYIVKDKRVKNQVKQIIKDIQTKRKGWWREYIVIEDNDNIQIIKREIYFQ